MIENIKREKTSEARKTKSKCMKNKKNLLL